MAELDRSELWATETGRLLHLREKCCSGSQWPRRQVKDFSNPAYFDAPEFRLCSAARARQADDSEQKGGRDGE